MELRPVRDMPTAISAIAFEGNCQILTPVMQQSTSCRAGFVLRLRVQWTPAAHISPGQCLTVCPRICPAPQNTGPRISLDDLAPAKSLSSPEALEVWCDLMPHGLQLLNDL